MLNPTKTNGSLEKVLTALGAAFSLLVTLRLWTLVASQQEMWPLPALYLVEVVTLPGVCAASVLRAAPFRARLTSLAAGALLAFSILGAWSVGPFYLPLVALLIAAAVAARARTGDRLGVLLAFLAGGAFLQAALMLLVVWSQ